MQRLSVVLIARDQEWNIPRLVESVLSETAALPDVEILLVDSASSDRTVELARRYPVHVVRLHAEQVLTAAAGRYVGYLRTKGELVLFLDGDMELCPRWLGPAMLEMQGDSRIAAIGGPWLDLAKDTRPSDSARREIQLVEQTSVDVRHLGGAGLYRRRVLEEVGAFNPFLYSEEEPELCIRMRQAGYRVRRLGVPLAFHYTEPIDSIRTLRGRRQRNLYLGAGQCLRYHLGRRTFMPYVLERGFAIPPMLALFAGLTTLIVGGLTSRWLWFGAWVGLMMAWVAVVLLQRRSWHAVGYGLVRKAFVLEGTIRGLLLRPSAPESYHDRAVTLQ
jgi:glycosyltransferase involved in cell wall biosynthesis